MGDIRGYQASMEKHLKLLGKSHILRRSLNTRSVSGSLRDVRFFQDEFRPLLEDYAEKRKKCVSGRRRSMPPNLFSPRTGGRRRNSDGSVETGVKKGPVNKIVPTAERYKS